MLMSKSHSVREATELRAPAHARGETLAHDRIAEEASRKLAGTAVVTTSLPRGGLQIAQPQGISESLVKNYTREFQAYDRTAWRAIVSAKAVRGSDAWSDANYGAEKFVTEFLRPHGFEYVAAAPLESPLLPGYPGVLEVFRTAEQGDFSAEDLQQLEELAKQADAAAAQKRSTRVTGRGIPAGVARQSVQYRQFILNEQLQTQFDRKHVSVLDDRLRQQMFDHARHQFENRKDSTSDRVALPDSHGDLWIFRVIIHRQFPALGEGAYAFFFLQPECDEWGGLKATDFLADAELSRLVPALKYMETEFSNGPTLNQIAKTVHLSPFHFHRRFTELLGITPKHFLLSCQIDQAKRMLVAADRELADIAKECGFAHQSHFTSRFKQATGLTPTRWRRLAREKGRAAN
jgi:AraC-like DNA-binding protein